MKRQLLLTALVLAVLRLARGQPVSAPCRQFAYTRYFRVTNFTDFRVFGQKATAGDMIELMPGTYNDTLTSATISKRIGNATHPIIFCGNQGKTIINGTTSFALRVVQSSYLKISGFFLQYTQKGLDVQTTNYTDISYITTNNTGQMGILLRLNTTYTTVRRSKIMNTGRSYSGNGEGIYIGTSKSNSVNMVPPLPEDHSDFNAIRKNTFGPGILAENIDIKEFTSNGIVFGNTFSGASTTGENGGNAWVNVKGSNWTITSNKGYYLNGIAGAGFKTQDVNNQAGIPGWGNYNYFDGNYCYNLNATYVNGVYTGDYCFYVDSKTVGTVITAKNYVFGGALLCNCKIVTALASRTGVSPTATLGSSTCVPQEMGGHYLDTEKPRVIK